MFISSKLYAKECRKLWQKRCYALFLEHSSSFIKTLFVEFRKERMSHVFVRKKNYKQRKVRINELLMFSQYYISPLNSSAEKKVFFVVLSTSRPTPNMQE